MILQLVIAAIGLIMYFICEKPKLAEVGRIMLWTGLLSFLLGSATAVAAYLHHQ